MNARLFALAALVSASAGTLAGCGTIATSTPVAAPVHQGSGLELAAADASPAGDYAVQSVIGAPSLPVFQDSFEKATQQSLDKLWLSSTDYKGPVPMIHPGPTVHQLVKPGLGKSLQAVAAGGGKAFSANRFVLELRQTLTASRGYEGSKRQLSFRYTPFVIDGPTDPRMKRPTVQEATAPLLVETSTDGKRWSTVWDSRQAAIPMIYPAPGELAAQVVLPAGNLRMRFVTVAAKVGQATPRLDDVVVSQNLGPIGLR